MSFYGNYIESLLQGAVAGPAQLNAGQVFPPFIGKQFELGTKLDLGNFGATFSAFQITQPVAPWTRVDAGASYAIERPDGRPVTIRANITNLFNAT